MNRIFRWCTTAAVGAAILLGACTDQMRHPAAPEMPSFSVAPLSGHLPDELYLIDNVCSGSFSGGICGGSFTGSDLYRVALVGSDAVLTHLFALRGQCAAGSGIDCTATYDRAHIGATPDGAEIWVVQNSRGDGTANAVGVFNVADSTFADRGEITGIGGQGLVMAGFNPQGQLFVGNQRSDRIYRLNTSTTPVSVTGEWRVRIEHADGAVLDMDGADIAFNAQGQLFIYTNRASNTGLYRVTSLPEPPAGGTGDAIVTFIANHGDFFTGLAFRAAGTGNLVMSGNINNRLLEVPTTGSTPTVEYTMRLNGALFDHRFGDMTTGRLFVPAPDLTITKEAGSTLVQVGSPITFSITVDNTGPVAATNVVVTDQLPGQVQGVTWEVTSTVPSGLATDCVISGYLLTCTFPSIAAGAEVTVNLTSSVMTAATCGVVYNNTADVVASNHPSRTSNLVTVNAQCPPSAFQGCTPGYWKNHTDRWVTFKTDDKFNSTFKINDKDSPFSKDLTLGGAIRLKGGGLNALARHATAALLNAANPGVAYPYTVAQIISRTVSAIAGGYAAIEAQKNDFDQKNNLGCPLGGTSAKK
jgi:uncharacterized repeat protein (TIGR01451 family)